VDLCYEDHPMDPAEVVFSVMSCYQGLFEMELNWNVHIMGVARGVGVHKQPLLLGKIFQIDCEKSATQKKSLKLTVKIWDFWEKNPAPAPKGAASRGVTLYCSYTPCAFSLKNNRPPTDTKYTHPLLQSKVPPFADIQICLRTGQDSY
jgi:hypothetical protein